VTATAERTRLDTLREQEVTLAEQAAQLLEKINTYPAKIRAAREEAFYVKPSKRPLAQLNSPLQKLIDAEKADVVKLNGLQADLGAVRNVIQQEDLRVRELETASARAQLTALNVKEEAIYKRAGEAFADLAGVWNELVQILEEESQVAEANGLEAPGVLAVEPVPSTFKSFLLLLLTAATDPTVRMPPHVQELTETGNYGGFYETRPAGTKTTEVRRRLDHGDRLFHLLPDLRDAVRSVNLSGKTSRGTR
jgi:hypothetical protein